ncbi:MAG: YaaR family protein [Bacillota bacterium]
MKVKGSEASTVNSKNGLFPRSSWLTPRQASFAETLKDTEIEKKRQACESILKEIDALSEELKKGATPKGVKKYRSLITAFVKEAMSQSYELQDELHWDREGNRKNLLLVKKINQSVEELMDKVINQEKKQIDLVAKLDEIRGMLIDLYF